MLSIIDNQDKNEEELMIIMRLKQFLNELMNVYEFIQTAVEVVNRL